MRLPITMTAGVLDVFSYTPVASTELKRLRVDAQTEVFQKIVERAKKKFECKKRAYQQARRGHVQSVCFMDEQERARHMKRCSARREAFYAQYVFGDTQLSWSGLLKSMGNLGDPWVYVERRASQQGLLDEDVGSGKRLREYCCAQALHEYVESTASPMRRIMLASDISDLQWDFELAAVFVQARVQQHVLVPLMQYSQNGPVVLSFTRAFAQQEKSVVKVALAASRRLVDILQHPPVSVMPLRRFWQHFDQCSTRCARAQHSLLYLGIDDPEVQGLPQARASAAKTFTEFIRHTAVVRGALAP